MVLPSKNDQLHEASRTCSDSVAERVAREVRTSGQLRLRKISKITSIHHAFRSGEHAPSYTQIESILQRSGVTLEKVPLDSGRNGGVTLTTNENPYLDGAVTPRINIEVTSWTGQKAGERVSLADAPASRGAEEVLWFHITVAGGLDKCSHATIAAMAEEVSASLREFALELERDMLLDLLSPDPQPKVDTYGDERTGVRHVSAMAVVAREIADEHDAFDGVDEQLVFQLVENLIGQNWIISCWHPARILSGVSPKTVSHANVGITAISLLQEPFIQQVRQQCQNSTTLRTSGDLGMALARELALTYAASQRMIERWVQRTEAEFFDGLSNEADADGADAAAAEIRHMLAIVGEFRRCLTAFEHARTATADRCWFPRLTGNREGDQNASVQGLKGIIEGAQEKLDGVFAAIRADMDLLMLQSMGRQQHAHEHQKRTSKHLQDTLTKATVFFLVPTLIAGIFGANTKLPGGGSWQGFEFMIALMIFASILVHVVIRKAQARL